MAWITIDWKFGGMPRCFSRPTRLDWSWEFTSAPRIATPVTAPISRLVLVAEAAMPDRRAGTADRAAAVLGTTVVPMPMPVSARAAGNRTSPGAAHELGD